MRLLSGLRAWTVQRLTAVLMLGFVLWFAGRLLVLAPSGYGEWRAFVAGPAASVAIFLFFAATLLHTWVGVRDVVLDYVHWPLARAALLFGVAIGLVATGSWLALALARLHGG